jgi:hypothetical protein
MRLSAIALLLLAAAGVPRAADPPRPIDPPDGSALPAAIPGYELRVLDVPKPLLFEARGAWIEASVPIFFYYPVGGIAEALRALRRARGELAGLGLRREWAAADLQRVTDELDAALRALAGAAAKP